MGRALPVNVLCTAVYPSLSLSLTGWEDSGGSCDCRAAGACSSAAGQAEKGASLCLLFISLRLKRHSFALHECFVKAYEILVVFYMTPARDVSFTQK